MEWKYGATTGKVVAGGNGAGARKDQLNGPIDVLVDKNSGSLIISDRENRRVVLWPRQKGASGQTIISDVYYHGLALDNDGYLYGSDFNKHEVRKWRIGECTGTLVAGGNGKGDRLNQLNGPVCLFVDHDHSVYISDQNNHRVMKWMKDAKEGILVAGGQGKGNSLTQLSTPRGVVVDQFSNVYVVDSSNHRVVCWSKGAEQGVVVIGHNGSGKQPNQLSYPQTLSFDRKGNLYVVDLNSRRVQRFDINQSLNV
jgi:sugar lactone lactonase YvrE